MMKGTLLLALLSTATQAATALRASPRSPPLRGARRCSRPAAFASAGADDGAPSLSPSEQTAMADAVRNPRFFTAITASMKDTSVQPWTGVREAYPELAGRSDRAAHSCPSCLL